MQLHGPQRCRRTAWASRARPAFLVKNFLPARVLVRGNGRPALDFSADGGGSCSRMKARTSSRKLLGGSETQIHAVWPSIRVALRCRMRGPRCGPDDRGTHGTAATLAASDRMPAVAGKSVSLAGIGRLARTFMRMTDVSASRQNKRPHRGICAHHGTGAVSAFI